MRFQLPSSPTPYLNRRDQFRLLVMVMMLSMVLIAIQVAKLPKTWYWLTGNPEPEGAQPAGSPAAPTESDRDEARNEYRVKLTPPAPLKEGEFISEPSDTTPSHNRLANVDARQGADANVPLPLEPELLEPIEDNTIQIRKRESDAYYTVLKRLSSYSDSALEAAAEKGFTFPVFMTQPDLLRGRMLTIEGDLQRLTMLPPQKGHEEVGTLYDGWLFTPESGNNPIRVICFDPGGISTAESFAPRVRVRFSGYFFKLFGYETTQHELHRAPFFLARRLQKIAVTKTVSSPTLAPYILGVLSIFALGFVLMVVKFTWSDRGHQRRRKEVMVSARAEDLEALKNVETLDVSRMLKQLAETSDSPES